MMWRVTTVEALVWETQLRASGRWAAMRTSGSIAEDLEQLVAPDARDAAHAAREVHVGVKGRHMYVLAPLARCERFAVRSLRRPRKPSRVLCDDPAHAPLAQVKIGLLCRDKWGGGRVSNVSHARRVRGRSVSESKEGVSPAPLGW